MKRGTRVGQAYVAITADGSGINKDIVDDLDGANGDIKKAGDRAGHDYGDEFGNGLEDRLKPIMDKMGEDLSKRLNRSVRDGLNSTANNKAANGLGARLGDSIGQAVSDRLEGHLAEFLDTVDSRLKGVSGNGGSGGGSGSGGLGGAGSSGSNNANQQQTLYKSYDFMTLLESARIKLHKASNDAIEKDDKDFLKSQQNMLDSILKMETEKAGFLGKFENARTKMHEASDRLIEKADAALVKGQEKNDKDLLKSQSGLYDSILKMEKAKSDFLGKFETARTKMHEDSSAAIQKDDAALVKVQQRIYDAARKESIKADADMWKVRNATAKAHYSYLSSLAKGSIDEQGNSVSRNRDSSGSDLGAKFGKLFGKGSRNNFVNIIGSMIGGVVGMLDQAGQAVGGFVKTFQTGMAEAGDSASAFEKMMAGGGKAGSEAMAALAESGPGAIAAIVLAASVLVSVISALVALVVALAATIASALVAAAGVAGAALLGLAAAGGLVAAAFMSMTNAQKHMLTSAFAPLRSEMVGIGQIMLTQMVPAFAVWSENLQRALLLLAPVAHVMGAAFARAGTVLTNAFSGPGFQAMSVALAVWLPRIIRNLSLALGGFLNGAMGLFAAIMPMVNRFAGYLAQVGDRFSKWANTAKGRNAVVDFVNRAVASLQSLWNATREVFGFIGDLLFSPEAQRAGNSMFDSIAHAFQGFRKAVARAIADGSLQKWFASAVQFGSALWGVIKSLFKIFQWLDSSHVLDSVTRSMKAFSGAISAVEFFASPFIQAIDAIGGAFSRNTPSIAEYNAQLGLTAQLSSQDSLASLLGQPLGMTPGQVVNQANNPTMPNMPNFNIPDLISSGQNAQNLTYQSAGGNMPNPKKGYHNPYAAWAQQFIDSGPSVMQQIRRSFRQVGREFNKAIAEASKAVGATEARSLVSASIKSAKDAGQAMVDSARSALSSAAQTLASASSKSDAAKALRQVNHLRLVLSAALYAQKKIQNAIRGLGTQKVVTKDFVARLLEGEQVKRATLADYAAARERLAKKIEAANQQLADAIAMRNDYKAAVVDAVKSFGNLLTAQAQTIDGVEQALTAADITTNLQKRLDQIRKFQENLRKLLAMGLNQDAYKQLVDGGVEAGSAYVDALVAGGSGAVADVNHLTDQISAVADSLGTETSDRLYNAGVAAAQGVVDGLEKLSDRLDRWAKDLGNKLVHAIFVAMNKPQGHGQGQGGQGQGNGGHPGNGSGQSVASSTSKAVAVSPEVATYASRQGQAATVSGNDPRFRDLIVHTPTANPKAVAQEVLNEVTGRL